MCNRTPRTHLVDVVRELELARGHDAEDHRAGDPLGRARHVHDAAGVADVALLVEVHEPAGVGHHHREVVHVVVLNRLRLWSELGCGGGYNWMDECGRRRGFDPQTNRQTCWRRFPFQISMMPWTGRLGRRRLTYHGRPSVVLADDEPPAQRRRRGLATAAIVIVDRSPKLILVQLKQLLLLPAELRAGGHDGRAQQQEPRQRRKNTPAPATQHDG